MSAAPRRQLGSLMYAAVLVGLVTGLALIAFGPWRAGAGLCGAAMLAGGAGRLIIPDRISGLLRVRRPTSDAVIMVVLGIAIIAMAVVIPARP